MIENEKAKMVRVRSQGYSTSDIQVKIDELEDELRLEVARKRIEHLWPTSDTMTTRFVVLESNTDLH